MEDDKAKEKEKSRSPGQAGGQEELPGCFRQTFPQSKSQDGDCPQSHRLWQNWEQNSHFTLSILYS